MKKEKLITIQKVKKYETICRVIKKNTQKTASKIFELSTRQVRNLEKQVINKGLDGVMIQ